MAIYTPNPKCLVCGAEIDLDDTYDMEYDEEGMTLYQVGHCSGKNCGLDYQWQRSAVFQQWANTDLREV